MVATGASCDRQGMALTARLHINDTVRAWRALNAAALRCTACSPRTSRSPRWRSRSRSTSDPSSCSTATDRRRSPSGTSTRCNTGSTRSTASVPGSSSPPRSRSRPGPRWRTAPGPATARPVRRPRMGDRRVVRPDRQPLPPEAHRRRARPRGHARPRRPADRRPPEPVDRRVVDVLAPDLGRRRHRASRVEWRRDPGPRAGRYLDLPRPRRAARGGRGARNPLRPAAHCPVAIAVHQLVKEEGMTDIVTDIVAPDPTEPEGPDRRRRRKPTNVVLAVVSIVLLALAVSALFYGFGARSNASARAAEPARSARKRVRWPTDRPRRSAAGMRPATRSTPCAPGSKSSAPRSARPPTPKSRTPTS